MAAPANTRRAASDVSSSPVRSPTADREIDETFLPQDEDGEGEGEGEGNDENNHDDNTAYSIDFDALVGGSGGGRRRGGHPDHDDDLTLDDTEPFDTLRSEDVDGPSDFTQNMEFWMRSKFSPPQAQQQRGKKVANADPGATPATAAGRIERDDGGDDENEGVVGNDDTLPPTRTPTESFDTQRDHVSDSEGEGEGGDVGKESEEEEGEHEGSFEYRQSENENTHEIAAAAMRDLNGYVISDEDTFLPPTSQPGSTADEHDGDRGERSRSGSIDEQIDILSSMDEGVEEEYRSVSASPALAQGEWRTERRTPSVVQRASWLQPTVEDHEDTPPLSARPSPRNGIGKSPEVWLGAYEEKLPKQRRMESISTASPRPTLRNHPRYTPRKVSEEDVDDLRAQIRRLQAELERQCGDFTAKIANLESQLQRTRNERDEARENEQQRVRDLNSQYDERAQDLEEHWQRRLATAQERYEQDVQEQKASFALVKSSFESRLAATESGLQAQLARKEAELDAVKEASKQELEQQRAGNDAKVATLEERIKELESSQQQQASEGTSVHATPSSAINQALTQQKAESDARIAELEARLSTTQSQLEAARTSSPEAALSDSMRLADERRQTDDLLARSRQQIADLEANLQLLQSQLALARRETDEMRRAADTAREGARVLRSELGRAQELVEERGRRLEEVAREHEADTDMAERARRDAERMLEERVRAAERKAKVLLERKVTEKESEVGDMRKRAETAVRKAQTMLNGERIEKAGLRRALEGLKEEVEGLRRQVEERKKDSSGAAAAASSSTSPSNHHPSPDAAEEIIRSRDDGDDNTTSPRSSELELLRRALRDATTATKEAREDARRAREESAALREDFAEVNRAMDERVVRLVRAREKEWRGKVEALAAEKRALGRALLHEWGREEVGEGEPQAYRYKYVERKESGGEKKGRGKA
ncbi:Spindle pole body associated protein [Lasiodiplodia theobromae]|uniref:Spindle pole body associated protein n=1 Tax=Lasiodiplodia theobromae TaxID=45133 RepID=UPI0015C40221|nr:Spindle pole body associated protein [Lasiodiplodia theobromae]KAF4534127.1 Spindle pole body associated protein [Lasiodiplodia theobromae]